MPYLRAQAADTLNFLVCELWDERGAFIAILSAVDVDDVEGGYYLIADGQLAKLSVAERVHWWRPLGGLHGSSGGYLPRQVSTFGAVARELRRSVGQVRADLTRLERALLVLREPQRLPRDTKLLAGWNGLALSALVRCR